MEQKLDSRLRGNDCVAQVLIPKYMSYQENFLDAKVSNLVKEDIGILELLLVRQAKTL